MENSKTSYRIFKKNILTEFVRIPPSELVNYSDFILNNLKQREKKCNKTGYIHKILKIDTVCVLLIVQHNTSPLLTSAHSIFTAS